VPQNLSCQGCGLGGFNQQPSLAQDGGNWAVDTSAMASSLLPTHMFSLLTVWSN